MVNRYRMDLNWKILFTDVSKKHTTEEAEEIFIVSTRKTTPSVYEVSKDWPHPWLLQSWQGKYGNARNYRIISPLGQEKFLLDALQTAKSFEKIRGIRHLVLAEYGLH